MTRTAIDPHVSDRQDRMSSVPALRTTDLIGRDAELEQLTAQLGIRTSGERSVEALAPAPVRAALHDRAAALAARYATGAVG